MERKLKNLITLSIIRIIFKHFFVIIVCLILINTINRYNSIKELNIILYSIILIYFIKFVYILINQIIKIKMLNCEDIEEQLQNPIVYSMFHYILTDKYIIDLRKFDIIKYEDIVLMYKKNLFSINRASNFKKYLYVVNKDGKKHRFLIGYPFCEETHNIQDFSDIISVRNKNVLIGKTIKNKK